MQRSEIRPSPRSLPAWSLPRLTAWAVALVTIAVPPAFAEAPDAEPPDSGRVDLAGAERRVFSQFGEDGLFEKIFEVIEPTNEFVIEFGAGDGVKASNARNLIVNHGWGGLLIEGDPELAARMKKTYAKAPNVTALEAWVYPGNIEILFEENGVPVDPDLLVIDIDSNDYYVWRAIQSFRPKVVMLEANPAFPPPQRRMVKFHPMNYWDGSNYYGASAQSLYDLSKKKGYELIHHSSKGNNLIFVRNDYFDRFGIEDNSPETVYTPVHVIMKKRDAPPFLPVSALKIPKEFVDGR